VMRYLIDNGVDPLRLSAAGYGKKVPQTVTAAIADKYGFLKEGDRLDETFIERLTPEQQEIADQLNRRTEFRVTGSSLGIF
jgi:peptidoglycan-associated lipoprotein